MNRRIWWDLCRLIALIIWLFLWNYCPKDEHSWENLSISPGHHFSLFDLFTRETEGWSHFLIFIFVKNHETDNLISSKESIRQHPKTHILDPDIQIQKGIRSVFCLQEFPENPLTSSRKWSELKGITGFNPRKI